MKAHGTTVDTLLLAFLHYIRLDKTLDTYMNSNSSGFMTVEQACVYPAREIHLCGMQTVLLTSINFNHSRHLLIKIAYLI